MAAMIDRTDLIIGRFLRLDVREIGVCDIELAERRGEEALGILAVDRQVRGRLIIDRHERQIGGVIVGIPLRIACRLIVRRIDLATEIDMLEAGGNLQPRDRAQLELGEFLGMVTL